MTGITTHVLDVTRGRPVAGMKVVVGRAGEGGVVSEAYTNADGRIQGLPRPVERGTYRLTFDTASYFRSQGVRTFYPEVVIIFDVEDPAEHYHVPLLLSPFGYTTYRGS